MSVTKEQKQEELNQAFEAWLRSFDLHGEWIDKHQKEELRTAFSAGYNAGRLDGYQSGIRDGMKVIANIGDD